MANDTITTILEAVESVSLKMNDNIGFMDSTWQGMTCEEAEAFAHLFRSAGFLALASYVIEAHARSDQEEDDHFTGEPLTMRIGDPFTFEDTGATGTIETMGSTSATIRLPDGGVRLTRVR
jgi:hypothetical protein